MASVCIYFQVHQPFRLRRYSVFDTHPFYFDNDHNRAVCERVATKCYRPATQKLLELVARHEGRFRVAFSITGTALQQFHQWTPDVIELFQQLVQTGHCELLCETSHHSLAFVFSREEFSDQVVEHRRLMTELFGVTPTVFRNTELIYSNNLAGLIASTGRFRGVLCEGVDRLLHGRSPNHVYVPAGATGDLRNARVKLLLKNHKLSDDVAFRFSDRSWQQWPLDPQKYAGWIDRINDDGGDLCNLFMDYETLGEHQWQETGIFEFLDALPAAVLSAGGGRNEFITPSEAIQRFAPVETYDAPDLSSWADTERDVSAWLGNALQTNAAEELFALEDVVKDRHAAGDEHLLSDWRLLTTSDHLYYMSTKHWSDGAVHRYFSPYDSPYDAYINFMNVLDNIRTRAGTA